MSDKKILLVSIIGEANAGKSTLLNKIIGEQISIVTHKKQTTRFPITGIWTKDRTQIIFYDTPGIFDKEKIIDKMMIKSSWKYIYSSNVILILMDIRKIMSESLTLIIQKLVVKKFQIIFLWNKIDIVDQNFCESKIQIFKSSYPDIRGFLISAKENLGIDELLSFLSDFAPKGEWLFQSDQITNLSTRVLASEITREVLLLNLRQEVPYNLIVNTDSWEEKKNFINIYQSIIVQTLAHKKIILGTKGARIKKIGIEARTKISALLMSNVNLYLHIKLSKLEKIMFKK